MEVSMSESAKKFVSESQQQRWVKYGLNVLLSSVVVVLLAVLVVYIAEKRDKRLRCR